MVEVTYFLKQFFGDSGLSCDDRRIARCRDIVTAGVRLDEVLGNLVSLVSVPIIPDNGGTVALHGFRLGLWRVLGHHNVSRAAEHLTCKSQSLSVVS